MFLFMSQQQQQIRLLDENLENIFHAFKLNIKKKS